MKRLGVSLTLRGKDFTVFMGTSKPVVNGVRPVPGYYLPLRRLGAGGGMVNPINASAVCRIPLPLAC